MIKLNISSKLHLHQPADLDDYILTINTPKFGIKNIFQVEPAGFLAAVPVGKVFFNEIISPAIANTEIFGRYVTNKAIYLPQGLVFDYSTYIKGLIIQYSRNTNWNWRYRSVWVGEVEEEYMHKTNPKYCSSCKTCNNNANKVIDTNFIHYIADYERAFIQLNSELFTN